MSGHALVSVVVHAASNTVRGTILETIVSSVRCSIRAAILIGPDRSTPEVIRHHVLRGEPTNHDVLEFSAAATDGAAKWLTSHKLLTKDELISADDWISSNAHKDWFLIQSQSLGVKLYIHKEGTLLGVEGCLIKHDEGYRLPCRAEGWGDTNGCTDHPTDCVPRS